MVVWAIRRFVSRAVMAKIPEAIVYECNISVDCVGTMPR
jgi:hypothetical protein